MRHGLGWWLCCWLLLAQAQGCLSSCGGTPPNDGGDVVLDSNTADREAPRWNGGTLRASSACATRTALQWGGATDNVAVVAYRIFRDGVFALRVSGDHTMAELGGQEPSRRYRIRIEAEDAAGNLSMGGPEVEVVAEAPTSATPSVLNPSHTGSVAASAGFLLEGTCPQQGGLQAAIDPAQAAVVVGKVLDAEGRGIENVVISALQRPEFGSTLTRSDGSYTLLVRGLGTLTMEMRRSGRLPAQRQIQTRPARFTMVPDVVLLEVDSNAQAITMNAPQMQTARGSMIRDASGARQATVLVRSGTRATLRLADGSTRDAPMIHLRATEFTNGPRGPNAMPGTLPPTTNYTYAVELSADEADAASGGRVQFDKPVVFYLENFLSLPVGVQIPVGTYDRSAGRWVAENNGRVVSVVAASNGVASLDINGDGSADDGAALQAVGIDEAERQQIATLYRAGQQLWRAEFWHFTPCDLNFPSAPADAVAPPDSLALGESGPERDCTQPGSTIYCESQGLGQRIPLAGTATSLVYDSRRMPGASRSSSLTVRVSDERALPASLLGIEAELEVAGRRFVQRLPPQARQTHTFTWDGLDIWGRVARGSQPAQVRVHYLYRGAMMATADVAQQSFDRFVDPSDRSLRTTPGREEEPLRVTREQEFSLGVGNPAAQTDANGQGLSGWTLDGHHSYDVSSRTVHYGEGTHRSGQTFGTGTQRIAGQFPAGETAEGVRALQASLSLADFAVGSDGSIWFTELGTCRLRRIDREGIVRTVAGGVQPPCTPTRDGLPAQNTGLERPTALALGVRGEVYWIENGRRIRSIDANGRVFTVAGDGMVAMRESEGDGGPATRARFSEAIALATTPEGALFVADKANNNTRLRRIGADGSIDTIAGKNTDITFLADDGSPAQTLVLSAQVSLSSDNRGGVFIADGFLGRVWHLTRDMRVRRVAGAAAAMTADPGNAATSGRLVAPQEVVMAPDGQLYFIATQQRVQRIDTDGVLFNEAGAGMAPSDPLVLVEDGTPALQAKFLFVLQLALDAEGTLYLYDGRAIYRMRSAFPGLSNSEVLIARADGRSADVFDGRGRHLRTVDTRTAQVFRRFEYDPQGRLTRVVGGDDQPELTLERSATGVVRALVGRDGTRTMLETDTNGFLARVQSGADRWSATYTEGGLMTSFTDPANETHRYRFEGDGRLQQREGANGEQLTLTRTATARGFEVRARNESNTETVYGFARGATGVEQRSAQTPGGAEGRSERRADGSRVQTLANGMTITRSFAPDPRFGMAAAYANRVVYRTPMGQERVVQRTREATLRDRANPLSVQTLRERIEIAGNTYEAQWDAMARTWSVRTPEGRMILLRYDERDRLVERSVPNVAPVQYEYNAQGLLERVRQGTRFVRHEYDAQRRRSRSEASGGFITSYTYDAAGRVTEQVRPDGGRAQATYDSQGNLQTFSPPGRSAHRYEYNREGRLTRHVWPSTGAAEDAETLRYGTSGEPLEFVDADGVRERVNYDPQGRIASVLTSRGETRMEHDARTGERTALIAPAGGASLRWSYDGALLQQTQWSGPFEARVQYTYDNQFRVVNQRINGGDELAFAYNRDGQRTRSGPVSLGYDAANGLWSSSRVGMVETRATRDMYGSLASLRTSVGSTVLFEVSYEWGEDGLLRAQTENVQGTRTRIEYTHDAAGRLVSVRRDGVETERYTWDSNNVRTSALSGTTVVAAMHDGRDRLQQHGSDVLQHDRSGRLLSAQRAGGTQRWSWGSAGELTSVQLGDGRVVRYTLDAMGRRVGRRVGEGGARYWLQGEGTGPIAELREDGSVQSVYAYGRLGWVPEAVVRGNQTLALVLDAQGSVRLVVNAETGEVVARRDYDAFGRERNRMGDAGIPFGYAGGWVDEDMGTLRFGAREYSPEWGRWLSPDPAGFGAGDGNLYGYVLGMPHWAVDPSGLTTGGDFLIGAGVVVVAGLVVAGTFALGGPVVAAGAASSAYGGLGLGAISAAAVLFLEGDNPVVWIDDVVNVTTTDATQQQDAGLDGSVGPGPPLLPPDVIDAGDVCDADPCEAAIQFVLRNLQDLAVRRDRLADSDLRRILAVRAASECETRGIPIGIDCRIRCEDRSLGCIDAILHDRAFPDPRIPRQVPEYCR